MTILERLADNIAAMRFDDLPPEAVHWAKTAILDTVGVTLAGAGEDCAAIVAAVLGNDGAASVHMTMHTHDGVPPRRFDLAQFEHAHETVEATGNYDVAVHGPNGFLRHFAGDSAMRLDVCCEYEVKSPATLRLCITNRGDDECIVTFKANAYDDGADRIVPLAGNASAAQVWDLESSSDGWYDVTVLAGNGFRWRFAGHVELGRASISG